MSISLESIVSTLYNLFNNLYEKFEKIDSLDGKKVEITKLAQELKKVLQVIDLQIDDKYRKQIDEFYDIIESATLKCDSISKMDCLIGNGPMDTLKAIKKELTNAFTKLNTLMSALGLSSAHDIKKEMKILPEIFDAVKQKPHIQVYGKKSDANSPVGKPTNLKYRENQDTIELTWKFPAKSNEVVESFEIWYDTSNVNAREKVKGTQDTAILQKHYFTTGETYKMCVRILNEESGPGDWSEEIEVVPTNFLPDTPENPILEKIGNDPKCIKIIISIPQNRLESEKPITTMEAQVKSKSDCKTITVTTQEISSRITVTHVDMKMDESYDIRIRFKNEFGWSEFSEIVPYIPLLHDKPCPPLLIISSKRTDTTIKLRWKVQEPHDQHLKNFEIQKSLESSGDWKTVNNTIDNQTRSFVVEHLKPSTKYSFRIRAINSKSVESDWSDTVQEKTKVRKIIKALSAPFVYTGGIVAAPFVTGAATGIEIKSKVNGKLGSCAAVAAGIGGGVLGFVGAPVIAGVLAYNHVNGNEDSESDEENDNYN